jgi:hypothetical protein
MIRIFTWLYLYRNCERNWVIASRFFGCRQLRGWSAI